MLNEAAGVLREALASNTAAPEAAGPAEGVPSTGSAPAGTRPQGSTGGPAMATAAKIQAQLEDLEARVLEGRPRIRAVCCDSNQVEEETALLDSGATHAVLASGLDPTQELIPCTVSLAGDQRQVWRQTPGGSLVAPSNDEGSAPQTILPLRSLVEELGCTIRWSKKSGLQLVHPRLGKLRTSLKGGCPQLSKEQALELVRELEGAKLGNLEHRLIRGFELSCALPQVWVSMKSSTGSLARAAASPPSRCQG